MESESQFYCLRLFHHPHQRHCVCALESYLLCPTRGRKYFTECPEPLETLKHLDCLSALGNSDIPTISDDTKKDYDLEFSFTSSLNDSNSTPVSYVTGDSCFFHLYDLYRSDFNNPGAYFKIPVSKNMKYQIPPPVIYSSFVIRMDGYFMSYLMGILMSSLKYRLCFYKRCCRTKYYFKNSLCKNTKFRPIVSILISLRPPVRHYLDLIGSNVANLMLRWKVDLDVVLSWLSTLGGASSCLGDTSKSWAISAGQISLKQFQIALRLNDPLITSRCKIYMALSLIQRGRLHSARKILVNEYKYFLSLPSGMDNRLGKMCKGVWHKLRCKWNMKLQRQRSKITNLQCLS